MGVARCTRVEVMIRRVTGLLLQLWVLVVRACRRILGRKKVIPPQGPPAGERSGQWRVSLGTVMECQTSDIDHVTQEEQWEEWAPIGVVVVKQDPPPPVTPPKETAPPTQDDDDFFRDMQPEIKAAPKVIDL